MENNRVEKILKLKRREIVIYSIIFFVTAMLPLFFSHIFWVKLLPFLAILVYIIVMGRAMSLKYLLEDECNPELYYYAYIGLNKREPDLEERQRVAELIGDFKTATELAYSRLKLCKNDSQRLLIILDIARISFDAGDFDLTRRAYNDFNSLKINAKVKASYDNALKFYMYFIEEDYINAKRHFDLYFRKYKTKKVKNILKYKMYYYDGLLLSALGENEKAQASFNDVIRYCPNLYIAKMSSNLLSDNAVINSVSLAESAQKGMSHAPEKKKTDYLKLISFILALVAIVMSLITVGDTTDTSDDTVDKAIANYCSANDYAKSIDDIKILCNIKADEKHIVSIFEAADDRLYVGYVKVKSNKLFNMEIARTIIVDDNTTMEYLTTDGMSKKLKYIVVSEEENCPKDFKCEKIKDNLYFCYEFDEAKLHILNSSGSFLEKSE